MEMMSCKRSEKNMESKYSYQFTEHAEQDLDETLQYMMYEVGNPKAAADIVNELTEKIEEVRLFPASGTFVHNAYLPDIGIRQKLIGNYIMYYLPAEEDKQILIIRIVYHGRNRDEVFKETK